MSVEVFLSTLSLRRATWGRYYAAGGIGIFLSTLSLRRATVHITEHASPCRISIHALLAESDTTRHISPLTQSHFYPRSPCGERPILGNPCAGCPAISIHALLAESDLAAMMPANRLAIISIHALLAESDMT